MHWWKVKPIQMQKAPQTMTEEVQCRPVEVTMEALASSAVGPVFSHVLISLSTFDYMTRLVPHQMSRQTL